MKLGLIVEGHGEVAAVPVLIRKLCAEHEVWDVEILRPIRGKRDRLVSAKFSDLERSIALATFNSADAIIVVVDADDACAATLGPSILARADAASAVPIGVVLVVHEYESWFLASTEALRGHQRVRDDAVFTNDPDEVPNPKAFFERNCMVDGACYSETVDQAGLSAHIDVEHARTRSASMDKFCREAERLLGIGQ